MFWKKLHFGKDFSVISSDGKKVSGAHFHRRNKSWKMTVFASEDIEEENQSNAWKKVLRVIGVSEYCAITGPISGAAFFRCRSVEMASSAQRGAVEFELPRHLLKVPEKHQCQYCSSGKVSGGDSSEIMLNVAVFPKKAINNFAKNMRDNGVIADEYIHPFMALTEERNTLILPEIDEEFAYSGESWIPMPEQGICMENRISWQSYLQKRFLLPEDVMSDENMMLFLVADVVSRGKVCKAPDAFKVLPDNVRPVRFRGHLIVSGLLVLCLLGLLIWRFMLTYGSDIEEYRKIVSRTRQLKAKSTELRGSIKRNSKELKEMTRLVAMNVGEPDAIAEFALLSETLPKNVLLSSIRWNETDIDMVMQCENDQVDIAALIGPLKYWKVGSLQQRQNGGSAVATITLKLLPYDAKVMK